MVCTELKLGTAMRATNPGPRSFVLNYPLVPVIIQWPLKTHASRLVLCCVVVAGSAATSMLHKICELEVEVAASISLCVCR